MTAVQARAIDHVAIAVHDADASARWYVENLGMTVARDEVIAAAQVRLLSLAAGDSATMLQLAQPLASGGIRDHLDAHGEGLHHVCFVIDDAADAAGALGEDPSIVFAGSRGRPTCFLGARPSRVIVELAEPYPIDDPA